MSDETFIYGLIILITLSFSVAFSFLSKKVNRLNEKYRRALEIMTFLNNNVKSIRKEGRARRAPIKSGFADKKVLKGSLTLRYNGEEARTKATFKLDD
tara:strand:+ start:1110 stop:1403 length:294 start_codon:yes stop_codon:yes gene_type:complete